MRRSFPTPTMGMKWACIIQRVCAVDSSKGLGVNEGKDKRSPATKRTNIISFLSFENNPENTYGSRPRLPLLPFLQPAYHRVPRQWKTGPLARMCYFLNFRYNHGRDCYRLLGAETGRVALETVIHQCSTTSSRVVT